MGALREFIGEGTVYFKGLHMITISKEYLPPLEEISGTFP